MSPELTFSLFPSFKFCIHYNWDNKLVFKYNLQKILNLFFFVILFKIINFLILLSDFHRCLQSIWNIFIPSYGSELGLWARPLMEFVWAKLVVYEFISMVLDSQKTLFCSYLINILNLIPIDIFWALSISGKAFQGLITYRGWNRQSNITSSLSELQKALWVNY